ncbi:MAG TPA: hypothetical protein VLD57_08290, partial [Blastocatellia bacterium]|nr:hypothetical protein [Blastocatellia bacterium]
RPFNGCVPQPEKKRRLFDSHNPNSLMVAELAATIPLHYPFGNWTPKKEKKQYLPCLGMNSRSHHNGEERSI